jgi:ubiquitin-protein ligase
LSSRLRRLAGDYKRVMDELSGNPHVKVRPVKGDPPEKYSVTYYVPGLFWNEETNALERRDTHVIEVELHAEYPRIKPKCTVVTPIFHPNFGQWVCIGDYWAAGETLVDVLVQIGDMIQYKVYNSKSPLNAVAARWATENSHLLPIGNVDLLMPDIELEIQLFPAGSWESDDLDITLF